MKLWGLNLRTLRTTYLQACADNDNAPPAGIDAFLPWKIECKGLASKILSLAARQIPNGWLRCYGLRAVLPETFWEYERHKGTCYKAVNWTNVGRTAGRGKKSTRHKLLIPAKDIWLYPPRKNFAALLCK